jgi:hypothetical protein
METNLFVITRLGQLRNVQGYINQFKTKRNLLILLYTPDAFELVENIDRNIDSSLFREIIHFELPLRPLGVNKKKCKNLYENLTETLYKLNKRYNIKKFFLCNTDNFYIYFEKVATKIHADIILLEEGLTTYRMFAKDRGKVFTFRNVKSAFKIVLRNFRKFFVSLIALLLKFFSWILKIDIFNFIKHKRIPRDYRYGNIEHFKEAYVCFPEKMKSLTTKNQIGKIKKLHFFTNKNLNENVLSNLENNMTLFVNQRYVPYDLHFNIVFEIFEKANIKKFFIKFHPKESKKIYWSHLKKAIQNYPQLDIRILRGFDHIPAEDLMITGKIKKIVGITTSTLIYSKLIDPNIKVLSIADSYKELCLSTKYNVDARKMNLFLRDYKAFKEIFDVKQI